MSTGADAVQIKRVRTETLVALKMLYPAPLLADQLFRSLLTLFPTLEWESFRRDLIYLNEKGYLLRVVADTERHADQPHLIPWRRRWFRLTPAGLEVAQQLVKDPALDQTS